MLRFDLLELQKNIEERRLIMAKKIENFLLQKLFLVRNFLNKIIFAKSCAFFGCFFIIALSLLLQSTRDLGPVSAAYIEITQKMLRGGKYYYNFFENSSPLSLLITSIPVLAAKFFNISPLIALQIFVNLIGIFSVFFAYKILSDSELVRNRAIINLLTLAFCCGFFLRVFTLQFNELGTKTSYFLALAFPYIYYHLRAFSSLKKTYQILLGAMAAFIICLKLHYGILVIIFEIEKLLKNRSLKSGFCLRNYVTFTLLIFYTLLLFTCFSSYIQVIPEHFQLYSKVKYSPIPLFIREDIFPIFLLAFLCRFLFTKNNFLFSLLLVALAAGLILITEMAISYDERVIFYSLTLPFLFSTIFLVAKGDYVDWKRDGILLLMILILPQFAQQEFFAIAFDIMAFWWMFILVLSKKWQKILAKKAQINDIFMNEFFLPRSFISWFYFLLLFGVSLIVSLSNNYEVAWIFFAVIFVLMLNFYQKLHEIFLSEKKISRLPAGAIFLVLSYIIGLHLASISNVFGFHLKLLKSPNYVNDQMAKIIKNYAEENEEIVVISSTTFGAYPTINYLKKENPLPAFNFSSFYESTENAGNLSEAQRYLFSRLKQQLKNKNNKLVFIERKGIERNYSCEISFLEKYFYDAEFKKIFLQNYIFLNRIIEASPAEKKINFFNDNIEIDHSSPTKIIERDVEVYIRK